jgi:hypothetical protein
MRNLLPHEQPLVMYLLRQAGLPVALEEISVRPMADGGMGSLAIAPFEPGRHRGSTPAECHFFDQDGVLVSAALNLDQHGSPYEVDVWKVDFSPTTRWPAETEIRSGPPN